MDKELDHYFNHTVQSLLRLHPLMASMDDKEFRQALQSVASPSSDLASSWFESVMKYQAGLAKALTDNFLPGTKPDGSRDEDRRFRHPSWNEGIFSFLRESYQLSSNVITEIADSAGLPPHEQKKLSFYARLFADAMAPSNFLATNPEAIQLARETNGQSLVEGFKNLLGDLEKGYLSTTDEDAFEVGTNLATTEGSVVFRNEIMELIQYHPTTPRVNARPVLIIPPCVNKFYIFDINEKKSMVRYLLDQGYSVFTLSWRNPTPDLADYSWDQYVNLGVFQALTVCQEISRARKVDLLSWCNGGTMLIAALAVIDAKLKSRVGTATFLSSMIDFSDPGGVEVFVDEPQITAYKSRLDTVKVTPGRDIARAMAMLHINESVWGFVVNNYLLGKSPPPFDILYWNADTSNLPAMWYAYYVEKMYHENLLKEPGALEILGKPVDTGTIDVPCFFVGALGDHIVPWKTSYASMNFVGGETEFVLTDGGHVSGTVINHPDKTRRTYFSDGDRSLPAEEWRNSAKQTQGSWWPAWLDWLESHADEEPKAAPKNAGNKNYPPLGSAPGSYVLEVVPQDA